MQFDIERRWKLLKKLDFYSGIGIAPTYIQLIDGKTTDGVLVSRLLLNDGLNQQHVDEGSKFSVNGGISFGLSYGINRSLNAELAYRYNQFFVSGVFINDDVLAKQQRSLSFLLSYKFK